MSRRASRKISSIPSYAEIDENTVPASPTKERTPKKKGRKAAPDEKVEVIAQSITTAARKAVSSNQRINSDVVEYTASEAINTAIRVKKTPTKRKIKSEAVSDGRDIEARLSTESAVSPEKAEAKRKVKVEEEIDQETSSKKAKAKRKVELEGEFDQEKTIKKVKKKRKTKEEKEAEAMPLAERTSIQTLKRAMYIGAHVSGAGGVHNSINNALHIGGNAFALFLKSQRKWVNPPLAAEARDQFLVFCKEHNYDSSKHVLPHGSYLVNLAAADPERAEQAYTSFLDDLQRCEELDIGLYNFHPGNTGSNPRPESIARIAANLNKAHKATKTVVTLLENMAGSGNVIGSTFEDLRDIIALVDDKSRVGVCIDTCHSFAAGYDLRSPEAFKKTMDNFSTVVGMSYLQALHLNDSKAPLSSHRDLHANIGTGFLGLRAFHNVVNFAPFQHLPMILETPIEKKGEDGKAVEDTSVWATEIKLLEGLIGADIESEEFKVEEQRLQNLGAEERKKFQQQVDKKVQKTIDSMFKRAKGKKKDDADSGMESEGGCSH